MTKKRATVSTVAGNQLPDPNLSVPEAACFQQMLPMLEGIGPLLPGKPDKRPSVGDNWPDHPGLSIAQLQAAAPECICWNIGAAPGHVGIDIDGAKAAAFCQSHGCDPYTADTWRIIRTSNTERVKLVFTVTPVQKAALVAGAKTVKVEGQELAVFAKPGTQIVVLGNHYTKESVYTENDDQYAWAGRAPSDAQPIPPEWFALLTGVFCGDRPLKPSTRRAVTASSTRKANAYSCSSGQWSNSNTHQPCPMCGRDHSGACSINRDGDSVWCCHGETKSAPDCSKTGETVPGTDGRTWAYVRTEEHDSFGERSLFVLHRPRQSATIAASAFVGEGQRLRNLQCAATTTAPQLVTPTSTSEGSGPDGAASSPAGVVSRKPRVSSDEVLQLLPYQLGALSLNVRTGEVHSGARGVISANEISRLYLELSRPFEVWQKDLTADGITLLASRNPFDPVAEYLEQITADPLPMEQWERLDQHLLGITDPIAASFLPRFFISAVARVFEPGCYVRQVPVLIGPQELGKGELGRIMFGAEQWVEGVGALDRDALMKAHTAWGVELAELDGVTRRADQEHLKAFITETADTYRKPYDRAPERHARKFVFWGTANRPPLRDPSGSTRFVCIPIPDRSLPLEWARQHRDELWARAVQQFRAGVTWLRTSEAERLAVEARNADFTELDPWAEPVGEFLCRAQLEGDARLPVKVADVLTHLQVEKARQTNALAKRVREIAEGAGWRHGRRRPSKGMDPVQGLWPPEQAVNPVHPVHPEVSAGMHSSDPSADKASTTPVHPVHPYPRKLEKKGGEQQGASTQEEPLVETPEGFEPFGVHGVHNPQTDCTRVEVPSPAGLHSGVHSAPSEDWKAVALKLRAQHPGDHPSTIANLLSFKPHWFSHVDGRKVKQLFDRNPLKKEVA